ncbi:hypothetical protein [Kitasatospora aureofaciens]|uniref:hypothetical protein n=1 Tax=Kitasatospora aureofaciens TaxID=1894 RepID=UPI003F4C710B
MSWPSSTGTSWAASRSSTSSGRSGERGARARPAHLSPGDQHHRPAHRGRHPAPLTAAATAFARRLLDAVGDTLPSAVALDVGPIADPYDPAEHWAVVEANLPWFAHCYAADPDRVLDVVLRAAGPIGQLAGPDRRFVRTLRTIG